MENGLIHIYTGNGKGKTTAAFGLALRAAGRGKKVIVLQFFKDGNSGEALAIARYCLPITIHTYNSQAKFYKDMNDREREVFSVECKAGINYIKEITGMNLCDVLILDEWFYLLQYGLLGLEEALSILGSRPAAMEIVMTGRDAPRELVETADYVTQMEEIKHPYARGAGMRAGIEW